MQGNRLMLIIAVVAGVMATVLAFTYINSATSAAEQVQPEPQVEVLFALNDLAANQAINPETDLRVDSVPQSSGLARAAIKAEERESLRGQRLSTPLPAGVPLLYSHLAPVTDIDLAQGARAMAIDVDAANLMGGILVPGDHVDIIVSYRLPPEMPDLSGLSMDDPTAMGAIMGQVLQQSGVPTDWEAEEVLTNIRVIAIGEQLTVSRQAHMFGVAATGRGGSNTVTLEVTPEQAKTLIRATAGGANPVTLLLRPTGAAAPSSGGSFLEE